MDQVKNIRSPDVALTPKISSMEWFARYAEYITPDTLITGIKTFKNLHSGQNVEDIKMFISHYHHSEAVPTCLQSIRTLKTKIESDLLTVDTYD